VGQAGWHVVLVALSFHYHATAFHPSAGRSEHQTEEVWSGSHLSHLVPTAEAIWELKPYLLVAPREVVFPHPVILHLDRENNLVPYLLVGP